VESAHASQKLQRLHEAPLEVVAEVVEIPAKKEEETYLPWTDLNWGGGKLDVTKQESKLLLVLAPGHD
jgi:hypothetical protein